MAIFLGMDGGGSKTICVVGDEQRELGRASAGGSNVIRLGEEQARQSLNQVIRQACAAAGVEPQQIERTCIGVAGAGRPEISQIVHRMVSGVVAGEVLVVGDMLIALEAAFGDGPGIVVIAGTGSIAFGRNRQGSTARAGGWGAAVSDEGSGHWIGRQAVAAVLRARDEGVPTSLETAVLESWKLTSLDQLVRAANASPPPPFAALFPQVVSAAQTGDAMARVILTQAANQLAHLARTVAARLFPAGEAIRLAMSGGVFANAAPMRQAFQSSLGSMLAPARVESRIADSVDGALALARRGMSPSAI